MVEEISSGPTREQRASGNRRWPVALFPTDASPTGSPSHFFIGDDATLQQGAFAPIRSRAIEGTSQIVRATGNRRGDSVVEGPLGPRADFVVSRRLRPTSLTFTPERAIVGLSPNSRSRERLRTIRSEESVSARRADAFQHELSSAQRVAQTLEVEMNNARENVEQWTSRCEQRSHDSELALLHRFELTAHEWTTSRDEQAEQMQNDWMVERGRLETLRTHEVQVVHHEAEQAVRKFEADLQTAVALEQHNMHQSISEAHVQQLHQYQSEYNNLEANSSQNANLTINRLRSELTIQAEALRNLSEGSAESTRKLEESMAMSHDRCVQLNTN